MSKIVSQSMDTTLVEVDETDVRVFFENRKSLDEIFTTINASISDFPSGHVWHHFNGNKHFKNLLNDNNEKLLIDLRKVLQSFEIKKEFVPNNIEENSKIILNAYDDVLDKNVSGFEKLLNNKYQSFQLETIEEKTGTNRKSAANRTQVELIKPQTRFKVPVDNSPATKFVPQLKTKPNALVPLNISENPETKTYNHPYEYEIRNCKYPQKQTSKTVRNAIPKITEVKLNDAIYIENGDEIDELVRTLSTVDEIAIDLEHNDYRSYQGITCLMQISTRTHDYLIDTLVLRDELTALNTVFTNPRIVKVFHGADSDVLWLQRDFSLYVVNMFDTYQAAKLLGYQSLKLASLLKSFCNIETDKSFQLADWRQRPLTADMRYYAVCDTHFLLHIYHQLKNQLIAKNLLLSCLQKSSDVCLKKYEKPVIHDGSHLELKERCRKLFDSQQEYVFRELFYWRDMVAREQDESPSYVLPNQKLFNIVLFLPKTEPGILSLCTPLPPLIKPNMQYIKEIIKIAYSIKLITPNFVRQTHLSKFEKQLNCANDLYKEVADNLPTLVAVDDTTNRLMINAKLMSGSRTPCALEASTSVFGNVAAAKTTHANRSANVTFLGAYENLTRRIGNLKLMKHEAILEPKKIEEVTSLEPKQQQPAPRPVILFAPNQTAPKPPIEENVSGENAIISAKDNDKGSKKKQVSNRSLATLQSMVNRATKRNRKQANATGSSTAAVLKHNNDLSDGEIIDSDADDDDDKNSEPARPVKKQKINAASGGQVPVVNKPRSFIDRIKDKLKPLKRQRVEDDRDDDDAHQTPPHTSSLVDYSTFDYSRFKGGAVISKNTQIQLKSLKKKQKSKSKTKKK